jgi:hypothetical protein
LKSNRENLFGPEEAPENPPILSVSHAIETYSARLFFRSCQDTMGAHNPQVPKTSTVATSANDSLKKSSLTRLEEQDEDGIWKQIQGKAPVEEYIAQRNVEQLSHAGKIPFGYTPLGAELGHTGNSPMVEEILDGTIEYESLTY